MTTGRINQVAILGHTSGPEAACSDSTLSARLRGAHDSRDGSRGPENGGGGKGPRGATSIACNGTTAHACSTTGAPAGGGHRAAPRACRRQGHPRRVAGHAPPHDVPSCRGPPTLDRTALMQAAAPKRAVDAGASGRQTEGPKGGYGSEGHHAEPTPSRGHGPASHKRAAAPRRFRRRPHRLACNIPGSGRGEARRGTATSGSPRLAPSTAPSRATHRTAGDQARRVGRSPVPSKGHTGSRPSVVIQAAQESAARGDPADFLDRIDARARAHRQRGAGPGHDTPSLIAYQAPRAPRARRVP